MKIALISPYDFAYPGGVTHHIAALEHHFTKAGHDVRVIAPASKVVSGFDDRFIPIGKPRSIPSSGSICRISISLRLAPDIKAVLSQEKFDIVHLHEPFMPMLCSAVLRFSNNINVGTFHACHGKPGYNFGWPVSLLMLHRRMHKLDGKIAVSKAALGFISKYVPGYYNIIPNGIDLERFSPDMSPIEKYSDGKLNILFVGRLESRKGLNYLIKAYQLVKPEIPDSRLIVVGPGTRSRHKYEKLVIQHGLKDVVFVGYVTYDELPRYYKTADIYCSPATGRESFGIVLLEAMAMGKPIVASNIEGYAGVMTNGAEGLLVPPRDKEMLAQALISLARDKELREQMGARGIVKAQEYNWERVARRVLDYYGRLLSESPQKGQSTGN
ncbi:glycosyltransferase family 4 protein [Chloroflexota bacterium]